MTGALLGLALLTGAPVWGADAADQAMSAELDRARAEIASQIQLSAYDLVDELIYGWTLDPIFASETPVVLAGVTVPAGLGTGLQALLENHINATLLQNPTTNIQLVHCPSCTAVVVRSGPEGTVIGRGVDDPEVLERIGDGAGQHALFIDVEAEGSWLVLRARLTRLTPELPIVWSHTLASSANAPALLRQADDLKSAEEARREYLDLLRGRGPVTVPARVGVRSYATPERSSATAPPPFIWLQTGAELGVSDARAWTSSVIVGYSFIPQSYQGIMAQTRINRLLTGRTRSLTSPDLYGFLGVAAIGVWGPATTPFQERSLNADQVLANAEGEGPRTSFGALHLGLDLRIGDRIGMATFLETMPTFWNSPNLSGYFSVAGVPLQSFGVEVTFCF